MFDIQLTGISIPGVGPNCFRTHEYRIAIVKHLINKPIAKLLIPTRPDERCTKTCTKSLIMHELKNQYTNVLIVQKER